MKLLYEFGIGYSRKASIKMTEVQDINPVLKKEVTPDGEIVHGLGPEEHTVIKNMVVLRCNEILERFHKENIPVAYIDVRMTSDGYEVYRYDGE